MKADAELDISGETCPMTFVRTKIRLEAMRSGELLRVRLRSGEPLTNVPRAVLDHGHSIVVEEEVGDDLWELVIRVAD